jgi:hypothetical protein
METLLTYTWPGLSESEALEVTCKSNQFFFVGFQMMSLFMNICLCADLILTIRNPFSPAKSRTKFYYAFSLLATGLTLLIIYIVKKG